ncbi:DUF4279 domain-containing protein [Variovorax sp.]|uniref:DUF4279 domain-containing protein n=1 Tax=Variovorax sp. TaxID=1871043 RepID=UPI003BA96A1A
MRTYCSLVISSDTDDQLSVTAQRVLGLVSNDVVDTQSPELIKRRARLGGMLRITPAVPSRYFWRLSSKDMVESLELGDHIAWLLKQLAPNRSIDDMHAFGSRAFISCFWASSGRGGGPVLPPTLMRMLAEHGVELQFDVYVEPDDSQE